MINLLRRVFSILEVDSMKFLHFFNESGKLSTGEERILSYTNVCDSNKLLFLGVLHSSHNGTSNNLPCAVITDQMNTSGIINEISFHSTSKIYNIGESVGSNWGITFTFLTDSILVKNTDSTHRYYSIGGFLFEV